MGVIIGQSMLWYSCTLTMMSLVAVFGCCVMQRWEKSSNATARWYQSGTTPEELFTPT
jgi:hypothetical protein